MGERRMESFDIGAHLRQTCLEMSAAWEPWWDAALNLQAENPAVRSRALQQPEDFGAAAAGMVMFFALNLHPTVLETARTHCRTVVAFLAGDPVPPVEYNRGVTNARRVEELERRVRDQAQELEELRSLAGRLEAALCAQEDAGSRPAPDAGHPIPPQ